MDILITWIAHDDLIYRIVGASSTRDFATLRPVLEKSAQSFHTLTPEERSRIKETRLRLVVAEPSETLEELGKRTHNAWSVEQTAIANGLQIKSRLQPGRLIKIARPEPYTDKPNPSDPDAL